MNNDSERDYANSIYDSMYECGQRLAEDERKKQLVNIWNAAIEAAAEVVDTCNREGPYQVIAAASRIRKLKK